MVSFDKIPNDDGFQISTEGSSSHYTSPMITPELTISGGGVGVHLLKPMCNPNILRTMAIPNGDRLVVGSVALRPRPRSSPIFDQ